MAAPSPTSSQPRSPGRALKIGLLSVLGVVVSILVLVPVLALAFDLGGVVRTQLQSMIPGWEAQIGRSITLGPVSLKVLPSIAAELDGLTIGAAPGQTGPAAEPLLKLSRARLGIAVWPMLRSLGKEVQVSRVEVDGLQLNVVRLPGGRLSYEDILDRLGKDEQPKPPLTPQQIDYLFGLTLSRVALTGAGLRFYDQEATPAPPPLTIDQLDIIATDVHLQSPFPVTLDAAVLAPQRNLHLGVTVGPFPRDLQIAQPVALLRRLDLKIQPLQISPLLRFLPTRPGLGLASALVDADLKLEMPAAAGKLTVIGEAGLRGLLLREIFANASPSLGAPTDVRLKLDLLVEPLLGSVLARSLDLTVGDMGVSGSADVRNLFTTPAVNVIALTSRGLLIEKLLAVLPPTALPKGAVLRGPLSLRAAGSGSPSQAKVELGLDLTGATLILPTLHKPEKTPLSAEFRGQLTGTGVDIDRLGLVLGPLSLWLRGQVRGTDGPRPDFDLVLDTGKIDLDGLLRLLPSVTRSVPPDVRLAGSIEVDAKLRRKAGALSATAKVALTGADARTPDFALSGGVNLSAAVRSAGGAAGIEGDLDLSPARIYVADTVDKAAGVPMRLKWAVDKTERQITVRSAELSLPGGLLQARGQSDVAGKSLDLKVPLCDLDMVKLGQVAPVLRKKLPGFFDGKLRFAMAVSGDPGDLNSMRAKVSDLELALAGGHVRGEAEVVGLKEPRRITFDVRGEGVDLDRLSGGDDEPKKKAEAKGGKGEGVPKFVKALELDGKLRLVTARTHGAALRDLVLLVGMSHGKAVMKVLRVSMLGGVVDASGTSVDLGTTPEKIAVRSKLDKIQVGEVLALKSPEMGQRLTGQGTVDLSVDGAGLTWDEMAPRLTGELGLSLIDGKLKGGSVAGQVVGPLLQQLAVAKGKDLAKKAQEMTLDKVACRFTVRDGKLHTREPLRVTTAEGAMALNGAIGLDQSLALTGRLELSPHAIQTASAGKLVPTGPVPVDLRIGGTLKAPQIEVTNMPALVASLAGLLLKGKARDLVNQLPGGLGDRLKERGVDVADPQKAVEQVQEGAQKKLQEEQQRLQQEAQKRIQEEQQRLQQEAQKRLGDGLKGLLNR